MAYETITVDVDNHVALITLNRPDALNASYTRYLINGLRESFGLFAVPIRLGLRKPDNPYAGKRKRPS